jgi:membrane-bound lytic murein transglycosylase D
MPTVALAQQSLFDQARMSAHRHGFRKRRIRKVFRTPKSLVPQVAFWRDIYSTYDRTQVVLHDTKHLGIVYRVVDLADITPPIHSLAAFPTEVRSARRARVTAAQEQVRTALLRLAEDPGRRDITAAERKIVTLFRDIPGGADKYKNAAEKDRLRSQTGLRNRFRDGIAASGKYLGRIEAVFQEEGVPWEITRLVFVESMFDLRAFSKVGASGIWQFMPRTATVMGLARNDIVDERNDPMAATRGATRLLKQNYEMLKTWPLAINAYNSGAGRLRQAVRRLGTHDISRIIHEFDHPGYQFASRNFFPEFLAALEVFERRQTLFGTIPLDPPLAFDTIITEMAVSLPSLAQEANVPLETVWELNPGYSEAIYSGKTDLPAGYALKVPPRTQRTFMAVMDRLAQLETPL